LRKLGVTAEVYVRGRKKSRGIPAVDLHGDPTKNVNNSTNIYPFDLIPKYEHDTALL